MRIVKEYNTSTAFQNGIDEQYNKGWILDSWQLIYNPVLSHKVIIAVFRSKN